MGTKFTPAEATQTTYKRVIEQQSGCCESSLHQQHRIIRILITAVEEALNVGKMMRLVIVILAFSVVFAGNCHYHTHDHCLLHCYHEYFVISACVRTTYTKYTTYTTLCRLVN